MGDNLLLILFYTNAQFICMEVLGLAKSLLDIGGGVELHYALIKPTTQVSGWFVSRICMIYYARLPD
jgi:hypothetical protein